MLEYTSEKTLSHQGNQEKIHNININIIFHLKKAKSYTGNDILRWKTQKYRENIVCLSTFQTYMGEKTTYIKVTNYFQSVQKENAKPS